MGPGYDMKNCPLRRNDRNAEDDRFGDDTLDYANGRRYAVRNRRCGRVSSSSKSSLVMRLSEGVSGPSNSFQVSFHGRSPSGASSSRPRQMMISMPPGAR